MRYIVAVIGLAAALYGADSALTLQKGIDLMESKGDVAAAITMFEDAARSSDRAVAARALFYLGRAQERLGKDRARQTYERIARDFADQREIAVQARERLAVLSGPAAGNAALTTRQLWTGKDIGGTVPFEIAPTADGRSVLFIDWASGDIGIRSTDSGEIKRLEIGRKATKGSGLTDFAQFALYSPDQRQIAYTWHGWENGRFYDFRVISTQRGAKPRVLIRHPELTYFKPFAWSPDGKAILTLVWKMDGTTQIAWVSASDGTFKVLKSLEWRIPETISLSPDGRYIAYDALEHQNGTDRDIFILTADGSSETTAVKNPGIDNHPVWTPDGRQLVFTSNRSRNFGLYALDVEAGKVHGGPRLLKPDVGPITLCGFVRSGALYYLQPTGDQNIYRVELDAATGKPRGTPAALASTYAANNGMSALSPDGKRVAYLATHTTVEVPSLSGRSADPGTAAVVVKSLEDGSERSFSTSLSLGFAPMWFPDGGALLLSARRLPAGTGQAFYRLDLNSGGVTRLLENQVNFEQPGSATGQRELSRDGDTMYLSIDTWGPRGSVGGGGVAAISLSAGRVKKIYEAAGPVGAVSLSPDERSLAVITEGKLIVMGADGRGQRTLFEARDVAAKAGLTWSSDGTSVLFVRGIPGTGWGLWRVPANGGEATSTGIVAQQLREIRSGPNGALTYTAGSPRQAELWALDNLLPMLKASR